MDEIKSGVKGFLDRELNIGNIRDDDDLAMRGWVNSRNVAQLVVFVEREYRIDVSNRDMTVENFKSVNAIAAFVSRKQSGR